MSNISSFLGWFEGKRTYFVAVAMVLYALASVYFHQMTMQQAVEWVLAGMGFGTTRMALANMMERLGQA